MTPETEVIALLARVDALGVEARQLLANYASQAAKPLDQRAGVVVSGWKTLPRVEAVYQALVEALHPDKPAAEVDEIQAVLRANGRFERRGEISTALSYLDKQRGTVVRQAYKTWTTTARLREIQERIDGE